MSQLTLERSEHGYQKIKIDKILDQGNLRIGCQRMDIDVYPKDDQFTEKVVITTGIVTSPGETFEKYRETPVSFRTAHISKIDEMIVALIKAKIRMYKLKSLYRPELMNRDIAMIIEIYKSENK